MSNSPHREDWISLLSYLPEMPPEPVISSVNPWKRPIYQIVLGLGLSILSTSFYRLDLILPAIGILFLLSGFRSIKDENPWFLSCYVLTILRMICCYGYLILSTTLWGARWMQRSILPYLQLAILFVLLLCLWRGFCALKAKAGLEPSCKHAALLILWFGIVVLLTLIPAVSLLIVLITFILYVGILYNLWQFPDEIEDAAYQLQRKNKRIPNWLCAFFPVLILCLGMGLGYQYGNTLSMNWTPFESASSKTEDVQNHLLKLGFPEDILSDLTEEDLLACKDAIQITVSSQDRDFFKQGINSVKLKNRLLRMTGIAVHFPDETSKIFQHFRWLSCDKFYGPDVIQLDPSYARGSTTSLGKVSGQVLYDLDGTTYASPFHSLSEESFAMPFLLPSPSMNIFAEVSFPNRGVDHRGYLSYCISAPMPDLLFVSEWIHYIHPSTWKQFPVTTAKEYRLSGSFFGDSIFQNIDTGFNHSKTP